MHLQGQVRNRQEEELLERGAGKDQTEAGGRHFSRQPFHTEFFSVCVCYFHKTDT